MVVSVYPLPRGGPISPVKHLPRLLSSGDISASFFYSSDLSTLPSSIYVFILFPSSGALYIYWMVVSRPRTRMDGKNISHHLWISSKEALKKKPRIMKWDLCLAASTTNHFFQVQLFSLPIHYTKRRIINLWREIDWKCLIRMPLKRIPERQILMLFITNSAKKNLIEKAKQLWPLTSVISKKVGSISSPYSSTNFSCTSSPFSTSLSRRLFSRLRENRIPSYGCRRQLGFIAGF